MTTHNNALQASDIILWLKPWLEDNVNAESDYNSLDDEIHGSTTYGTQLAEVSSTILKSDILMYNQTASALFNLLATEISAIRSENSVNELFSKAAIAMAEYSKDNHNLGDILLEGGHAIQVLTGANRGDKTFLDIWIPASERLAEDQLDIETINHLLHDYILLNPKGKEHIAGKIDPEALSLSEMFKYIVAAQNMQ